MNFKSIYNHNFKLLNGFCFLIFLLVLIVLNPLQAFRYDCRVYWELAHSYDLHGYFSLYHYNEALRGYLFPLILYPAIKFSSLFHFNEILIARCYLALIAWCVFSWVAPKLFQSFFKTTITPFIHSMMGVFLLLFWWEYFTLPLSDFIGMACLFAALALARAEKLWHLFFSGLLLYASINIRLAFLAVIPLYAIMLLFSQHDMMKKSKLILFSVFGFLLLAWPQYLINRANFQVNSLFVPTQASKETGGKDLFLMQLNWGLSVQKYETNIDTIYPVPQVRYMDEKGVVLSDLHGNRDFESYPEYFSFVWQHPSLILSYAKHFFNALDLTTPRAYLKGNISSRNWFLPWLNFSVIFLALFSIIHFYKETTLLTIFCLVASLLLAILVTPTAIEVRFFMPLHVLFYFFACYFLQKISSGQLIIKGRRLLLVWLCYLCFSGICIYRSINMKQHLEFNEALKM